MWIIGLVILGLSSDPDEPRLAIFRDCERLCPEMTVVPAGTFIMGEADPAFRHDRDPEPATVVIDRPFAMGSREITFAEFDACVDAGACPRRPDSEGQDRERTPAFDVTWHDAQAYVQWLSALTGHTYRLPTGAEWEYAARAGSLAPWSTGETLGADQAHFWTDEDDRRDTPSPVGSFPPNGFGLHDMHGNLEEWVEDCMNGVFVLTDHGPLAPDAPCLWRGLRGGAWTDEVEKLRNGRLWGAQPTVNHVSIGFRVVREL